MTLSELMAEAECTVPVVGRNKLSVSRMSAATVARVEAGLCAAGASSVDDLDGLSLDFADWRLNLRASNTEPLLRLNVESRGRPDLVAAKVKELTDLITRT